MDTTNQQELTKLSMEYSDLMQEYCSCLKRDDVFSIKRRILKRMRTIEQHIKILKQENMEVQHVFGNY